jgi:hypothetical protein
MLHDRAWTVALTLTQDDTGTTNYARAIEILRHCGQAALVKK